MWTQNVLPPTLYHHEGILFWEVQTPMGVSPLGAISGSKLPLPPRPRGEPSVPDASCWRVPKT